jgi:hypothetical protein
MTCVNCRRFDAALSIHFEYSPPRTASGVNLLTLTVLDADGWRGEGHRHAPVVDGCANHHVDIGLTQATSGYVPGPLPAGRWNVVIDEHSILADAPVTYTINVMGVTGTTTEHVVTPTAKRAKPIATARQIPGWYRGDLHAHTLHSDAAWDAMAFAAFIRARGLDFATLSDPNP